jgi:hypothetical protein
VTVPDPIWTTAHVTRNHGLDWHDNERVLARDWVAFVQRWGKRDPFGQGISGVLNGFVIFWNVRRVSGAAAVLQFHERSGRRVAFAFLRGYRNDRLPHVRHAGQAGTEGNARNDTNKAAYRCSRLDGVGRAGIGAGPGGDD